MASDLRTSGSRGLGRQPRAAGVVLSVLSAAGCVGTRDADHMRTDNAVGLFEPTDRVDSGVVEPVCLFETVPGVKDDAGAGSDDKPVDIPRSKLVSGTLSISFSTTPPPWGTGAYDNNGKTPHYGVVWLEDTTRRYVKTLELWGLEFKRQTLVDYRDTRFHCEDDTMDVMTRSTIQQHIGHSLEWHGENIDEEIVPQGSYVLWLELESDQVRHIDASQIPFVLGDMPWTRQFPPMPLLKDLTLTYAPKRQ